MQNLRNLPTPSIRLQLRFTGGMLLASPAWLLVYKFLGFDDGPLCLLIGMPLITCLVGLIWFRQYLKPEGTGFKPK